jgi:hypothetical protein
MLDTDQMDEAERKAYANRLAMRQEENRVKAERAKGNLSWRIAREFDVLVITKAGKTLLVDCKRSDNCEFIIDGGDIIKLLDLVVDWNIKQPAAEVEARFEMWFSRTRQKNNKRDIEVTEDDRGWSIKCTKTRLKIMTQRVRKGGHCEDR